MTRHQFRRSLIGLSAVLITGVTLLAILGGMGAALVALLVVVVLVTTIPIWLAPIFVAHRRGVRDIRPIAVFTLLAGWTFIGWIAALAWALATPVKTEVRVASR